MRPDCVVLPAPAIGQGLSLRSCGEQLGIGELIPEAAIEWLGKAVLPWRSWRDVDRAGGGSGLTPVQLNLGDELRTVVRPDECWRGVEGGEFLQHRNHILGLAAPAHLDGQGRGGCARRSHSRT